MSARRWLPPLVWAGVMLVATSIPNPPVPPGLAPFDKVVHFAMYALLAALIVWGWSDHRTSAVVVIGTLVGVAAYGALDEWHQQFIPGRSMDVHDWLADVAGALVGATAAALLFRARTPSPR